ncbi:relaxase domain-containing protein [Cellulosimicrobium cellulans]|uniref:relaxase domain-containing protein n=1 Tax=Cellulosimicrobium cellulans TaxID=1710 RepID=UPI003084551D
MLDFLEREVAATRTGHGGVAQAPVVGVAATAYDHWDSRANDPQLHTHVVISNKVEAAQDGKWRTLDSRALHHAVVEMCEHYNAVLADRLTTRSASDGSGASAALTDPRSGRLLASLTSCWRSSPPAAEARRSPPSPGSRFACDVP